jgi:hypothetical protein
MKASRFSLLCMDCGDEIEYEEVLTNKHPIHWIHCGDKIEEYDEVFTNTQSIGFIVMVMK